MGPPSPGAGPVARPPAKGGVDPFIGKMVGNFRLTRRLGAGGMGAVYEGVHPIVGIRVAVKLLGGTSALDADLVDRFFSEARTLNQVSHENIVKVIDLGRHAEGFYYCVMELLEGETLAAVAGRGRVDIVRGVNLLAQACDALQAAHEKGIVHRDLKPANIMLVRHPITGAEVVKLVDFGIAKLQGPAQNPLGPATIAGTVIGTPAYMSPEQAAGRVTDIDPRSDLYSLGLVAYELLTGKHPWEGRPVGEIIVAQITEEPTPPAALAPLPPRLNHAILRLLAKRREERFRSADTLGRELRLVLEELRAPANEAAPVAESAAPPPVPVAAAQAPTLPVPVAAPVAVTPPPATTAAPPPEPAASDVPPPAPPMVHPPPPPPPVAERPAPAATTSRPQVTPLPPLPPLRRGDAQLPGPVRVASRRPAGKPTVRPMFLLALLLTGGFLGAVMAGAFDAEKLIASAAQSLGLMDEPAQLVPRAPATDGVQTALAAAPPVAGCKQQFDRFRLTSLTGIDEASLQPALERRLQAFTDLSACLDPLRERRATPAAWAANYLEGLAAFEFGVSLQQLDPKLKEAAHAITTEKSVRPFHAKLYAGQARDRFEHAKPLAPEEAVGFIERYLDEAVLLDKRAQ